MSVEELLERIAAERDPDSVKAGELTNQLLREFQRGYPIDNLRHYLGSSDPHLVSIGIWIASELGAHAKSLLSEVSALVSHSLKRVRFFAVDCILLWATPSDQREIASVLALIEDPEAAVRWKTLDFLSRASREQLESALAYLLIAEPKSKLIPRLQWLLGPSAKKPKEVLTALDDEDALTRKYGVVAAVRMSKDSPEPLLHASSAEDSDIRAFAESSMRLL